MPPRTSTSISSYRAVFCVIWIATAAVTSGGGGGPLVPVGLRTELEPSPFGVRLASAGGVEVSWELAAVPATLKNKTQSAYQLTVYEGSSKLVCTTGKVTSRRSSSVALCGTGGELRPGQLYEWTAQAWDEAGVPGGESAPATFGTALEADGAHPTAWRATPIWPAGRGASYAFFRAQFPANSKQLRKAVAYVTATADLMETGTWNASHLVTHRISGYSLYINGQWVAQGPGRAERHTEQVYDAIDITEFLLPKKSGVNDSSSMAEQQQPTIASHGQSGSLGGAAAFPAVPPKCQDSWCLHELGLPAAEDRGFMLQVLGWFKGSVSFRSNLPLLVGV